MEEVTDATRASFNPTKIKWTERYYEMPMKDGRQKNRFKNIFPTYPNIVCLVEIKTRSALSVFVAFPSATPFSASDGFQCRILAQRTEMKRYIAISHLTTLI